MASSYDKSIVAIAIYIGSDNDKEHTIQNESHSATARACRSDSAAGVRSARPCARGGAILHEAAVHHCILSHPCEKGLLVGAL